MILIIMNTKEWGGVDVIAERFTKFLQEQGVAVAIVDDEGSRLRELLPSTPFYTSKDAVALKNRVTNIFFPSAAKIRDSSVPLAHFKDAKVFSWVVHQNDVFQTFFPFSGKAMDLIGYRAVPLLRNLIPSHRRIFDRFFRTMVEGDALSVMDGATKRSLEYFVPSISPHDIHTVPVPSPLSYDVERFIGRERMRGDQISIGYLGRLDIMKWTAIKSFVQNNLVPLARRKKVSFHVVSEGGYIEDLHTLCEENNIEILVYGYRPNMEARQIISTNTDLAIAMGTSALDIAASGHPCIIIDPAVNLRAKPQAKCRFVHEIEDFTLGEFRDFPLYVEGIHKLEDALDIENLESARALGYKYVSTKHDPSTCFASLLQRIQSSKLTAGDAHELVTELSKSFSSSKSNPIAWFH